MEGRCYNLMQSCGLLGAVTVLVLLMSTTCCYGNADEDSMICYKPPPPLGAMTDHNDLFLVNVTVLAPPLLHVEQTSASVNITDKCGIGVYLSFSVNIYVLQDSYLECNTTDQTRTSVINTTIFTVTYTYKLYETRYFIDTSKVTVGITVEHFAASAAVLKLICKVKFNDRGGILQDSFISALASLELQGCPHALHGAHCDQPCSCAAGVECHPFTGDCVCPIGLQGQSCNRAQPLLLLESPSTVYVRYGEAVTLTCVAYGMVPTRGLWDRNQMKLETRNHTENVSYNPRPFLLNTTVVAASPEANGIYTCDVVNKKQLYRRNLTVIVTDIPEPFLEAPSNQSVILGSRVEFRCRTKPEAGTLTWIIGNQTISHMESNQTSGQSLVVMERNQTVSIIIETVRFEDVGRYRCIVGHEGANDYAIVDAWLTVESSGTLPNVTTMSRSRLLGGVLRVREGQSVSLMCHVREAYPQPTIIWLVGNEDRTTEAKLQSRTSSNGVSYDMDSHLTFSPTWHDDGKDVICVASLPSFQPDKSRNVHLNVSYAPKVTVSPREKTVQPGDKPLFTCNAPANPQVTNYSWTLHQKNGTIIRRYTGRSVRIHVRSPDHNMATLTCFAANDVGTNNNKAVIKVFDDTDEDDHVSWLIMITVLAILVALMIAVPILIYKHRGKIQDLFFKNKRAQMQEGKMHDVFVAYKGGGEEEEFVIRSLVPKLEEWGCDVCIHYQNFLPGREIVDNITAAVTSCRKTLLVLSPDFMASEWCYFEFLCAMDEMLRNQTNFIIPLMLREIRNEALCHSMRNLLDTVSFVPWPAAGQGQSSEFWKLLKRAVEIEYNVNKNVDASMLELNNNVPGAHDENANLV